MSVALIVMGAAVALSLSIGPRQIDSRTIVRAITTYNSVDESELIIRDIRLPRAMLGLLVGGSLAAAGAVMQGVTRNPLAGPSIMGLAPGGSLAVLFAVIFLPALSYNQAIAASLAGSALGYGCVLAVASLSRDGFGPARLALAGVVISSLFAAVTQALILYFTMSNDMLYWTVGGIANVTWAQVIAVAPLCLVGLAGALVLSREITVLNLGSDVATGLGQKTARARIGATLCVLLLTGGAVAVAGPVGFVGLMVPHAGRLLVGTDYRRVIPLAFIVGGCLTELADVASRTVLGQGREIPLGVFTAAIGAPCFIWLILRRLKYRMEGGVRLRPSSARHRRSPRIVLLVLLAALVIAFLAAMHMGYAPMSPPAVVRTLLGHGNHDERLLLLTLRLPRSLFAILAGAGIAVSGAMLQSVLRNDLAEPGILGVAAGAHLGNLLALTMMTSAVLTSAFVLPGAAVCGALTVMVFVYLLCLGPRYSAIRLLLTGVAVSAALAPLSLLLSMEMSDRLYRFSVAFSAGSLTTADWNYVMILAVWLGILVPLAWSHARVLNVLRAGDETAIGLGVALPNRSFLLLSLAVAISAACMALAGGLMFLGLIAPHIGRRLVGQNHKHIIPVSALIGAILLLLADRTGATLFPVEIPAGIMVAFFGAPYFLYLLARP
jgi:iron complex transport system permease protein